MVADPFKLSIREAKARGSEFDASSVYRTRSRKARVTQRIPVSKKPTLPAPSKKRMIAYRKGLTYQNSNTLER